MLSYEIQKSGLCWISILLGMTIATAHADIYPAISNRTDSDAIRRFIVTPLHSETWFIAEMNRLRATGDYRIIYQMGQIGLQMHPDSVAIRLGLAHAALISGRCAWGLPHLRALEEQLPETIHRKMADSVTTTCLGGWQQTAHAVGISGRRKSLLGTSQRSEILVEPGSRLNAVCRVFTSLCAGGYFKVRDHGPSSGTDIWLGVSTLSQKLTLQGGHDLSLGVFRRMPTRSGFTGNSVALRYGHFWQRYANKTFSISMTARASEFARGKELQPVTQSHLNLGMSLQRLTGPNQNRFVGNRASKRWRLETEWRLDHTISMAGQQSHNRTIVSYNMAVPIANYGLSLSARLGRQVTAKRVPRQFISLISGGRLAVSGPMAWPVSIEASLDLETRKYQGTLAHLARPHSEKGRILTLAVGHVLGAKKQFKVEILAKNHKISSENTLAVKSAKSLTIYFKYEFSE